MFISQRFYCACWRYNHVNFDYFVILQLVSSFKIPNNQGGGVCHMAQKYNGHKDGVWGLDCQQIPNSNLLGTASAGLLV